MSQGHLRHYTPHARRGNKLSAGTVRAVRASSTRIDGRHDEKEEDRLPRTHIGLRNFMSPTIRE